MLRAYKYRLPTRPFPGMDPQCSPLRQSMIMDCLFGKTPTRLSGGVTYIAETDSDTAPTSPEALVCAAAPSSLWQDDRDFRSITSLWE